MDKITQLYIKLYTDHMWRHHKLFVIWVSVVQWLLVLNVLSVVLSIWFMPWWWKIGIPMFLVLLFLNEFNKYRTRYLFNKWHLKKKNDEVARYR